MVAFVLDLFVLGQDHLGAIVDDHKNFIAVDLPDLADNDLSHPVLVLLVDEFLLDLLDALIEVLFGGDDQPAAEG